MLKLKAALAIDVEPLTRQWMTSKLTSA